MRYWTKYDEIEVVSPDKRLVLKISFNNDGTYEIEPSDNYELTQLDTIQERITQRDENLGAS